MFMFMEQFIPKILSGEKTTTFRRTREYDKLEEVWQLVFQKGLTIGKFYPDIFEGGVKKSAHLYRNHRLWHYIGQRNAIVPGRGKSGLAHIIIDDIDWRDVRCVTNEMAIQDGFENKIAMLAWWTDHYLPSHSEVVRKAQWFDTNPDLTPEGLYKLAEQDHHKKFESWRFVFHLEKEM